MRNKSGTIKTIMLIIIAIVLTITLAAVKIGTGFIKSGSNISLGFDAAKVAENIAFKGDYNNIYESIYCSSDAGNVEIRESNDNGIHVTIYSDDDYSYVYENDNELSIISYHETTSKINPKQKTNVIIVEVPSDYVGIFDINTDYGNTIIGSFENATISVFVECGNVEVKSIKNADIDCKLGDIKIGSINSYCNIYNNCGNIEINNFNMIENSYINDDLGNITIHNINNVCVDANTDLGKVEVDSNPLSELVLTIYNSCGNIEVNNKSLDA